MTILQSKDEFLEYNTCFEDIYKQNTIIELKQCYKVFLEKSLVENSYFNKTNQIKSNLQYSDSMIDNLNKINSLSTNKDKVKQLLKIVIETHSRYLKGGVYFNYLKEYNGEFIIPIGDDYLIEKLADSFWCDFAVYCQENLCLKGLKLMAENEIPLLPLHYEIKKSVKIKSDELIEFIQMFYKSQHYRQERTVAFLVYIFSSSTEIIYSDNDRFNDDEDEDDDNDDKIIKSKDKVFTIYKVIKNLYSLHFKNKRIESILLTVLEKILEPTEKSIIPIKENPINFNRYKWMIKKIKKYYGLNRPELSQPIFNMIVDSEEFVDFIFETNDFYNIPNDINNKYNDSNVQFLYDYQFKCPFGISKTFKTFELALHFEKRFNFSYQSPTEQSIIKSYQFVIYRSTFLLSILNCDIESIKKVLNHLNDCNDDFILVQNKFKKINIQQLARDDNRNLNYKLFNDEKSRDSLLNYLNSTHFKFFDNVSLKLFSYLLPTPIIKRGLIPYDRFKFNSNKFLYTDVLLNSILSLDFKITKQLLDVGEVNISIENVEKLLLKNKKNYPVIVDHESLKTLNNYNDIKDFINYLLFKLLNLLNNNLNDIKKFELLFQILYKHLIQSKGISSLNDLIEIHKLFENYRIDYLSSSSQYDHAFYIFVWSRIKYFKISRLVNRFFYDSLEFRILLDLNYLSFDNIIQTNSLKELVYKIFPKHNNIEQSIDQENEICLTSLANIGEVELFFEYSIIETDPNAFNNLSFFILQCNKIKEFLMLSLPGFEISWFIKEAIHYKRIEIIEYLFSNLYNETIETLKDHNLFLQLFETNCFEFFNYFFENHLEFILITFKKIEADSSKTSRFNSIFRGQTDNINLWNLFLKYVPEYFKINDKLVEFAISEDLVEIVQYHYEIGVIKPVDFSQYSIEMLKLDSNYKYLQWVIDLENN
ncbi:hypothetical protein ACTFIV_008721 [Dictyostelium citrinum]